MIFLKKLWLISLLSLSGFAFAANPVGYWQLKDKTGQPIMIIRVFQDRQGLSAKLIEYIPNRNARCSKCEGKNADKPIHGMVLITDLQTEKDNQWSGGKILNPLTGKVSKVQMTINAAGTELKINSYGFLSWFGSADVWTRRK